MTKSLWDVLSKAALARADHPAVIFAERRLSYAHLADRAARASAVLWSLGVRPGDRVAFLAANRPEYLELLFGAARLGASLVPINTRFGTVDLQAALQRCGAKAVFYARQFRKQDFAAMLAEALGAFDPGAPFSSDAFPELQRLVCLDADGAPSAAYYHDLMAGSAELTLPPLAATEDARGGLLLFTSGSSGLAKPVVLREDQLIRNMESIAARQGIRSDDRVLSFLPYFHVFGGVITTLVPLLRGGTIVMLEAFEATASLEAASREKCTVVYSVAPCYRAWLDHPERHRYDLSSVRTGVCSAGLGPMSAMAKRVRASLCPMHSLFGMTETTGVVTFTEQGDSEELTTETAGRPLPGGEVRIADPSSGAVLPPKAEGEIQVRGPMITSGYFRLEKETARAFTSDGWLRTGDQGWVGDDGYLRVIGRLDDRLRSGGENIDPREVEAFLQTHPKVAQCQVVGVPHRRLGEVPVAFAIAKDAATPPSEEELIAFCRGRIANFKVPRHFFIVEEMPGWMHKIQRHRLKEDALRRLGGKELE